jgi:hypothetical protein
LLVGDLAACHAAFDRLQQRVLGLALAEQATDDEETSKSTGGALAAVLNQSSWPEAYACIDEACETSLNQYPGKSAAAVDGWRDLVPLCRALRETLTSLRELSHFTRKVREGEAEGNG